MLNFLTFNQLDYQCLKQAGNLTDNDIYPVTRQNYVNSKLMKIYGLLDGTNDPFYNRSLSVMTLANDQEFMKDAQNSGGEIAIINATTKTIVRNSGTFKAGSLLNISYSNDGSGAIAAQWSAIVVTGGPTATYAVLAGTDVTLSAIYDASVHITNSFGSSGFGTPVFDASTMYFKDFTAIYDDMYSSTPGQIRVFDKITDPRVFFNRSLDLNALKRIAWYQQGDTILFFKGANANAFGTVSADYRGKPAIFTDASINNIIDIPPELNQALIDEVVASYLVEVNKPIPQDIQQRLGSYEKKIYDAAEANKLNAMEKANK